MTTQRIIMSSLILICLTLTQNVVLGISTENSEMEKLEYKQDLSKIEVRQKSLVRGQENDLKSYEKFADEIQEKWKSKNSEDYAGVMLKVCTPLSSGRFKEARRYEVSRKYALSALAEPNDISLETELKLTGHVVTLMFGPGAPKGEK